MSASLLQILGGFLTVAACGLLGQALAKALSAREKALATVCHGLALLATEIDYGATPLPQALSQISQKLDGEVGSLFRSAAYRLQKEKVIHRNRPLPAASRFCCRIPALRRRCGCCLRRMLRFCIERLDNKPINPK